MGQSPPHFWGDVLFFLVFQNYLENMDIKSLTIGQRAQERPSISFDSRGPEVLWYFTILNISADCGPCLGGAGVKTKFGDAMLWTSGLF